MVHVMVWVYVVSFQILSITLSYQPTVHQTVIASEWCIFYTKKKNVICTK